jgi:AraC-like DNA-binding protein
MSSSRSVREKGGSAAEPVRRILERGLGGDWPSSEQVAARMSVSLQHLRRRLREEGTSISQIREKILKDAAIASLARGDEPVSKLSARLGFSEPSAFRRAFRRWTGRPPGAFRSLPYQAGRERSGPMATVKETQDLWPPGPEKNLERG